jgi:hypothetical protein
MGNSNDNNDSTRSSSPSGKKSASFSLFGGLDSSAGVTSSPGPGPADRTSPLPSNFKTKAKRRASASTSKDALPLLLPAGSTLGDDTRAIIDELESWDSERSRLEKEIAEAELALLRRNRKLCNLKQKKNGGIAGASAGKQREMAVSK